jgi:hypothetical protein
MVQIINPSDRTVKGPWLLDNTSLEDLHNTLVAIEDKLQEAYNILLDKTAEDRFLEYKKAGKEISIEEQKENTRNGYVFNNSKKYILISTKQGKTIKDESLISVLKAGQINEFNPTKLEINIEKGPCEFTLTVSPEFDGELVTRIKVPEDNRFNDINYEINKWIDQNKPNVALQKWSRWFPFAILIVFPMMTFILLSTLKDSGDSYKNQLAEESKQLLKGGLTPEETTKAMEIILKKESGYVPEGINREIELNKNILNIWIYTNIALALLSVKPKTVIGLGKNRGKMSFYRIWIKAVLVFIPLSIIVPFIVNKIS